MRTLALMLLIPAAAFAGPATLSPAEVDGRVALNAQCVRQADAQIATQHEIGEASGMVDRRALYIAGMNKVQCKHENARLAACRASGCPRDGLILGANPLQPVTMTLPKGDMP